MISASRHRNSNCRCTRLLINMTNSDHITTNGNRSNVGIAGCGSNLTVTSTCRSHSISQFISVQCHRSLIQTQTTSRLTDCPRHFLGSSRTITPTVIRFRSKRSLICTSGSLFSNTANGQLCCIVIAECRCKFCPCISQRTTLSRNSGQFGLIGNCSNSTNRTCVYCTFSRNWEQGKIISSPICEASYLQWTTCVCISSCTIQGQCAIFRRCRITTSLINHLCTCPCRERHTILNLCCGRIIPFKLNTTI